MLSAESLDLVEGDAGQTYTVKLSSEPTATTTVVIEVPLGASLSLSTTTLTFTKSNWSTEQTVRVTATQDDDAVNEEETLTHTANGGDYRDVKADLTVRVDDDDETGVALSTESLDLVEGGAGQTYTVKLSSEPTATATVAIEVPSGASLSLDKTTLTVHHLELGHPPERDGNRDPGRRRCGRRGDADAHGLGAGTTGR